MNGKDSELARLDVRDTAGVFAARQLGRGLAATLALERQDQVRVATLIRTPPLLCQGTEPIREAARRMTE